MTDPDIQTEDFTEGYQEHSYPLYVKLLFVGLIVWGVIFMGYFLLSGYDSEAEFDRSAKVAAPSAVAADATPASEAALAPDAGETLYAGRCRSCHGAEGKGGVGPDLTRADYSFGRDPESVYRSIAEGRPGGMPAFQSTLTAAEIRAIADYILALP